MNVKQSKEGRQKIQSRCIEKNLEDRWIIFKRDKNINKEIEQSWYETLNSKRRTNNRNNNETSHNRLAKPLQKLIKI